MAKILLIEDDAHTRKLISDFLTHHGHEVLIAPDGAFGVSMSALEQPDLILLDMMLPIMSGPEALDLIKDRPNLADIPVVVISANTDLDLKQDMLNAGVVAYLTKPFDLENLLSCIQGTLTFRPKSQ
jgi:CheY-like chemotaxis protein